MLLSRLSRRWLLAPTAALLALPGTASAIGPNTWIATTQQQCGGPSNTFIVPSGVHSVGALVSGASGGSSTLVSPAAGATLGATLSVTPGEHITACVGMGAGLGGDASTVNGFDGGGYASL